MFDPDKQWRNYINAFSFITETVAKVGYSNDAAPCTKLEMTFLICTIGLNLFYLAIIMEHIFSYRYKNPLQEYSKMLDQELFAIFRSTHFSRQLYR